MISRKFIWVVVLGVLGVLAVSQWAGNYPARVVLINQSSTVQNVTVRTSGEEFAIGTLKSGETRVLQTRSGDYVSVEFDASAHRRWQSPEKLVPAQSLMLNIRNETVQIANRRLRVR